MDLDQYNRPVHTPNLPDWALPRYGTREQGQAKRPATGKPQQSPAREETLAKIRELDEGTLGLRDEVLSTSMFEEIVGSSEEICHVTAQVTNGGAAMPSFKSSLSSQKIADVAAYVVKSTGGTLP